MDTHVPTCINAVEKLSKNEKSIAKNVPIIVIAMPMQSDVIYLKLNL